MKNLTIFFTIAFLAGSPAYAADEPDHARELEEARRALQEAARRVAELSTGQADRVIRNVHIERFDPAPVLLGVRLGGHADGEGILIQDVVDGGPAGKAGLRAGDVLLSVGGKSLARGEGRARVPALQVREALRDREPGDEVNVTYRRGRRTHEATVTLDENPAAMHSFAFAYGDGDPVIMHMPDLAGLAGRFGGWGVRPLGRLELVKISPELGRYFGTESGLLVVRAHADNPLRLREGDVLLNIDGRAPESPVHAMRILRSYAPGETARLEIMRDRERITLDATLPPGTQGSPE